MYDFLLIAGVALWGAVLVWYLRHPAASIYHPATYYLLFHGVLFTLRPILARVQGFDTIYRAVQFIPTMHDKIVVLLAADLSFVIFMVVALKVGSQPFSLAPGAAARLAAPRFTKSLWVTLALCLPLALTSLYVGLSSRFAGISTMVLDARAGTTVNTTGNGYLTDAVLMLGPLTVMLAWAGRFRWWSLLPALLFGLAKAGTGGRWPFVMAAMSLGLYWMYTHRLRWFSARAVLAVVPLLLLFTVVGVDRGAGLRALVGGQPSAQAPNDYFKERPLESMDFGNMEFFEFLVHVVPGKTGTYDYFLSNLQIFTEPIPRVLWAGKPVGAPVRRFYLYDHGVSIGMTFALPGIGWLQAGWLGVAIWAALFGCFYGMMYRWFVQSDQDRYKTMLFMTFLPISLQVFRDGVLLTVLKTSMYPLLPILLWRALRFLDEPVAVPRAAAQPA